MKVELKDAENSTQLYIENEFIAGWNKLKDSDLTDTRKIRNMIRRGIEWGRQDKSREIRNVLGIR